LAAFVGNVPSSRPADSAKMVKSHSIAPDGQQLEDIPKLDNVTWFGHCVIHVAVALRELPTKDAKLHLIESLWSYLERRKQDIDGGLAGSRSGS
jgi:hypothetical protein